MDHYQNNGYQYRAEKPSRGFSSPLPFAIVLIVIAIAGFCVWYFFLSTSKTITNQSVPLIEAEKGPVKIRPDNSAQPEVPHKDKLVYGRVNPAEQKGTVEKLLPLPEDPVDPTVLNNGVNTDPSASSDQKQDPYEPVIMKKEEDNFPSASAVPANSDPQISNESVQTPDTQQIKEHSTKQTAQKTMDEVVEKIEDSPATQPERPVAAPAPAAVQKTLKNGFRVQVASMKSQELAKSEWDRINKEYHHILNGVNPHYSRVDLGAKKGIYYRVQIGDYENKEQAENVCREIRNKNPRAGCLVVRF